MYYDARNTCHATIVWKSFNKTYIVKNDRYAVCNIISSWPAVFLFFSQPQTQPKCTSTPTSTVVRFDKKMTIYAKNDTFLDQYKLYFPDIFWQNFTFAKNLSTLS